jgi:hypothetical protein
MKGSSTLNLRPQEIFSKYEQSIFLVKASSNIDIRPEKPSDTNSADVDSKSIKSDDLPDKLRSLLKTLPEREKSKIFGAYKAGYNLLLENPDSFLIIKSDSIKVIPTFDYIVIEFDSIVSYKSERLISGGSTFNSILMNAFLKCDSAELNIRRQEFKSDVFGIGKTLTAKRVPADSSLKWSPIKSATTQNFLVKSLCDKK